jgi:hypothetical protein
MANTEAKLGQQMDKIAYGVAIVLGLIVLAVPFLFSGTVDSGEVDRLILRLGEKAGSDTNDWPSREPEDLRALVEKHWRTAEASTLDTPWVTERAPLFLKLVRRGRGEPAAHHPARLSEIRCERDPKKQQVFLIVKGFVNPENQYVKIDRITIERSVDGGPFKRAGTADNQDEFTYEDYKVEPGKTYSYRAATRAKPDPEAPDDARFDALTVRQVSEPGGPTPAVPPDYSFEIGGFKDKDDDPLQPQVIAKLWYWDYKKGQVIPKASGRLYGEKAHFGSDQRWALYRVDAAKGEVQISDKKKLVGKDTLTDKAKRVAVKAWDPWIAPAPEVPGEDPGEEGSADFEEVSAEEVTPEPAPKKPTSRKKRGFSGRRNKAKK